MTKTSKKREIILTESSCSKLNEVASYRDIKISTLKYDKNTDILFCEKMWTAHIFAAKLSMYLKIP